MSTGIPYLGSKISLISKSEIRYEGILYTIDTKESTVALAKVRSFGTEDRPTDRPVAPRDEVYEYIIFRAHDIKDLRVSEPPKPQSTLPGGLTNDPAIVQVTPFETTKHSLQHTAPPATGASFPAPSYSQPPPYGPVGTLPSYAPSQYQSQPQLPQSFVGGSQQSGSRSTTPTPTPGQRKSPTMDAGVQVSGPAPGEKRSSPRSHSGGGSQAPVGSRRKPQQQPQGTQGRPHQQQQQQQGSRSQQQQHHMGGAPGQAHLQRGGGIGRRGGSGGGGRPRSAGYRTAKPKEQLKFDREYDFEQANAEFQELESKLAQTKISECDEKKDDSGTETQVGDNHEDDDVVYYDKTKSFFDNISCEAIERSKGMQRIDWRQERKLNSETFGVAASNWMRRNAWRGRGGFWRGARGGRGRGGPQGARGGGRPRNGSIPGMPGMRVGPTQVPTRRTENQPGDELH